MASTFSQDLVGEWLALSGKSGVHKHTSSPILPFHAPCNISDSSNKDVILTQHEHYSELPSKKELMWKVLAHIALKQTYCRSHWQLAGHLYGTSTWPGRGNVWEWSGISGQWPQCPSSSDLSHTQIKSTENTHNTMGGLDQSSGLRDTVHASCCCQLSFSLSLSLHVPASSLSFSFHQLTIIYPTVTKKRLYNEKPLSITSRCDFKDAELYI